MTNQEAIEILNTMFKDGRYLGNGTHIPLEVLESFNKAIEALENQKTGHWISKPNIYGVVYCSECDYELHTNNTNYCPNCGAKMEELKGE